MKRWTGVVLALALVCGLSAAGATKAQTEPAVAVDGPVPSTERAAALLVDASADRPLLIVGELHGSKETPALVAQLVRQAAKSRPVRLGLEMPGEMDAALHAYLRSAGNAKGRAALLRQPFWSSRDGRSSTAMFGLIEAARALRVNGDDVDAFATEPIYPDEATVAKAGGYLAVKETGMATAIRRVLGKGVPHQLVIALMGNYHARESGGQVQSTGSVAERLAAFSPYVVLPLAVHSQTWNCMAEGCGVHAFDASGAPSGHLPRLVTEREANSGPTVVKLWLARFTASYPAGKASP